MKRALVVLCFACLAFVVWFLARGPEVQDSPRRPRLHSPELVRLSLTGSHKRRLSTLYTYESAGEILKIKVVPNVDAESARILAESGIMGIEALHAGELSPYPGDISKRILRNQAYRPRLRKIPGPEGERVFYLLHANERLGFGAATPEGIRYRALIGWFYCESSSTWFQLKYFAPLATENDALERLFLSFTCG